LPSLKNNSIFFATPNIVLFLPAFQKYFCNKKNSMGYFKNLSQSRWPNRNRFNHSDFDLTIDFQSSSEVEKYKRGQDIEALEKFNEKVRNWGKKVNAALKASIQQHVEQDVELSNSLKNNYYKDKSFGEIYRVGFSFRPEGVYVHLGVGKGYRRVAGTTVRTAKKNTFKERKPVPWFNPVIKEHIADLEKTVREYSSDLVMSYARIFINS
jgi:hypothetical protein